MPSLRANGIELYYERRGVGRRLLFLNGSGATTTTSAPVIDQFAGTFDVAVHDQRGLGRTSVPPGPYTMDDYASDGIAVLDHLEWDTARVIGISFGGMVAQELAVTWPARVERLALLCTSPGGEGGASYPLHELADLPTDERVTMSLQLLDSRFDADWFARHPADRALVEALGARWSAPKGEEQRRGEAEQLGARRGHDVWDRLDRVTAPTLVACGRYDGIAPPANGEAIAKRIPDAELRVYEGGHAFLAQDPRAVPEIVEFLSHPETET